MTYLDIQPMFDDIEIQEENAWEQAKRLLEKAKEEAALTRQPVIKTAQYWHPTKKTKI